MAATPNDNTRAAVQTRSDEPESAAPQRPIDDAGRPPAPSAPRFGAIQFLPTDDLEAGAVCDIDGECC
jgi:hypothetical protein